MKTLLNNTRLEKWIALPIVAVLILPQLASADTLTHRTNPFLNSAQTAGINQLDPDQSVARAKDLSNAFRAASNKVLPSLVAIETRVEASKSSRSGRQNPFAQKPSNRPATGIGSGVIIDESGVIITNNHVVMDGKGEVTVRLNDGREFSAAEVLTDPKTDIAVIRLEGASGLTATPMGDSDSAEIGDWVLALGQPFGLESTVTAGIISAKQRGIGMNERESYIQTDAAINPGNSGGPLVNLNGEIVGINTAISSRSGGNEGIGFAVPINLARWVGGQLMSHGTVKRAYIGVGVQELDATLANQFGVSPRGGVVLTMVQPDSPAAKAGLKTGDVLVSFDNIKIWEPSQLQLAVERCEPGQSKKLNVVRNKRSIKLSIVPNQISIGSLEIAPKVKRKVPVSKATSSLGLRVESLDAETAERLGVDDIDGVVVTGIARGGLAQQSGLKPGYVIAEVNHRSVKNMDEFTDAMKNADGKDGILLLVRAGEGSRYLVLKSPA
ncbi:Do family serine endopeptidase [Mariniblastus fucicola]|uniref:Periplasmic serine endoprotease DegP n=1 Tax=Mariniblastus fucicola TaxID=980251 RepID=A0A5B9PE32_9BACT|nr:Do family serine endopeptidase [Mariniblastus fucicola]QEG23400.1 Periplasmic serine endoprotease DegP precursor [Mariniblastus fucicola]